MGTARNSAAGPSRPGLVRQEAAAEARVPVDALRYVDLTDRERPCQVGRPHEGD